MRNSVIAIQSIVITTILHALLVPVFFEMDNNAFGEKGANFVDDDDDKTMMMDNQTIIRTLQNVNLLAHLVQKCALQCVLKNLFFISFSINSMFIFLFNPVN